MAALRSLFVTSSLCLVFTGCSPYYTNQVSHPVWDSSTIFVDGKQRAVMTGAIERWEQKTDEDTTRTWESRRVCAEPSPDAISALSSSISLAVDADNENSLQIAQGLSEAASYIGLRTQSIQLLRDGMYRTCEAYLSGAISPGSYSLMMENYQRYMVGILAIEQLTGTIKSPPVAISASAKAQTAQSIESLQRQYAIVLDEISRVEAEQAAAATKSKEEGLEESEKTELNNKIAASKDQLKKLNATKEAIAEAIGNAQGNLASTVATMEIGKWGESGDSQSSDLSKVSDAVKSIALRILDDNRTRELCSQLLSDLKNSAFLDELQSKKNNIQQLAVASMLLECFPPYKNAFAEREVAQPKSPKDKSDEKSQLAMPSRTLSPMEQLQIQLQNLAN